MHIPPSFAENHIPTLHAVIRDCGLAVLVDRDGDGLAANHLPLLLDPDDGPLGALYGHLARNNPQASGGGPPGEALAIFTGPDAYVSPAWYPSKVETARAVPTWNYVAVHAYGRVERFDDPARLRDVVAKLTDYHEDRRHTAGHSDPWRVDDAPADYLAAMLKGIVGVKLTITRLEGKRKLSQNRDARDQAGVVAGLRRERPAQPVDYPLAALMAGDAGEPA